MRTPSIAIALLLAAAPLGSVAYADRKPTPAEREFVSEILQAHGFVSWDKIELDDGIWEVDDAVTRSGKVYDVKISHGQIIDAEREK